MPRRKKKKRGTPRPKKKLKEEAALPKIEKDRRRKKIKVIWRSSCADAHGHFCQLRQKIYYHLVFFLFWKENILMSLKRKHMNLIIYFSSFLPNQTRFK